MADPADGLTGSRVVAARSACVLSPREVITIQKFLEAAARQETSGKVRIQNFIENLLRRIALAERLLEYYQVNSSPPRCSHQQVQQARAHTRVEGSR